MARAALGWTLRDLADRAKVNLNTISRYEAVYEILTGTMQKIEDALRNEGVVFIDEDEDFRPAIRIRKESPLPLAFHSPLDMPFTVGTRTQNEAKSLKEIDGLGFGMLAYANHARG